MQKLQALIFCLVLPPETYNYSIMANTSDISRGMIIKLDGSLYTVVEFGENKTARAAAKVWAKLKGVDNNRSIEKTWNSGDSIYPVRVERKDYQYLYKDESGYSFTRAIPGQPSAPAPCPTASGRSGREMSDAPRAGRNRWIE